MIRKGRVGGGAPCFLAFLLLLAPLPAFSAQVAMIRAGSGPSPVYPSPDVSSEPLESLSPGAKVYASDRPSSGFYKVKTPSGKIGWIESGRLAVPKKPAEKSETKEVKQGRAPPPLVRRRSGETSYGARVFGGLSLFTLKEQNELHEVTELKNGTGFGAEFLIRIGRTVWLVLHLEKISKSLEIQEASGNAYATTTSSLPVMVGGDVDLAQGPAWRLGFTGLVGLGLSTRYSQQATSMAAPNITEYDGSPVTLMGRFDGELMFSPTFGAGAYLGYRVLNAPKVAPAVAGRTYPDDPLRDASGASSMLSVNLSGMILGAGLVLRL